VARGSIRRHKRAKGVVYEAVVDYGAVVDPATGLARRRQRSKSFPTRKEADAALTAWQREIDTGTAIEPSKMTVADLLLFWLDDHAAPRCRTATLIGYRNTITLHLIPHLGDRFLQKLTPADVTSAYARMRRAGLGARSVALCHQRLRQALGVATALGLVARNVTDTVQAPRHERREMQTWSATQAATFLAAAERESACGPLWLTLLSTGLRRGEVCGLRWRDVHLERGTLTVAQAVANVGGTRTISPPKTAAGRRVVAAPQTLIAALISHRARQSQVRDESRTTGATLHDNDLVFCMPDGQPLYPDSLRRELLRLCRSAGVPPIRVHDLRHTYATLALDAGVDIRSLSRSLGHHKPSITSDVYGHLRPERHFALADVMERVLKEASERANRDNP